MEYTHYDILGVKHNATTDEIKSAYKKLCRNAHPDLGGTEFFFNSITKSFEVLGDPSQRAQYDSDLSRAKTTKVSADDGPSAQADRERAQQAQADRERAQQAQADRERAQQAQADRERAQQAQ
ncbi:DnaJ domain-containing protein, partial [Ornithinimicrobium sp. Arc0846-15]|nr:DnaJ domain-containing protein [Ornithinimicrobium laminariae]